jgi:hypothetical protein
MQSRALTLCVVGVAMLAGAPAVVVAQPTDRPGEER